MKEENEITVEVDLKLDELISLLEKNNLVLKQKYSINDIYMINSDYKNEEDKLKLLSKCLLLRHVITDERNDKVVTYKDKEYNDKGEIIKQSMIDCKIEDIDNMKTILEKIGIEELIRIEDHMMVYGNDEDELVIQVVNDKHVYIEIEAKCWFIDKVYNSIDELKEVVSKYSIPIKNNDYFVKKALIELEEKENGNS